MRRTVMLAAFALPAVLGWGLPSGASTTQQAIHQLYLWLLGGAVLLVGAVVLLLLAFSWRYRAREGGPPPMLAPDAAALPDAPRRAWIAAYTLVPAALVFGLAVIGYQTFVEIENIPREGFRVQVLGQQFQWEFVHPDGARSHGEARVPLGEVVILEVSTRDVIHSFYVPDLGVKIDAVPGVVNRYWFRATQPGEFPAACAEYCGLHHAEMRARVIVEAR